MNEDKRLKAVPPYVAPADTWFKRFPNGGTVYAPHHTEEPREITWFRRMPNGGGTVYQSPTHEEEPS